MLIHEHQSDFLKKHSCQTALVKLIDQWMSCIDKVVGSLFLNLRKAFDVVDHTILIENSLHTNLVTCPFNGLNPILTDEDRQSQKVKVSLSFYNSKCWRSSGIYIRPYIISIIH